MAFHSHQEQQASRTAAPAASVKAGVRSARSRQGYPQGRQAAQQQHPRQQQHLTTFEELARQMFKTDCGSSGDSDAATAVPVGDGSGSDTESSRASTNCMTPVASHNCSPKGASSPCINRLDADAPLPFASRISPMNRNANSTPYVPHSSPEDFAAACRAASTNWTSRSGKAAQKAPEISGRQDGRREKGQLCGNARDFVPQAANFGLEGFAPQASSVFLQNQASHQTSLAAFVQQAAPGQQVDAPLGRFECDAPLKVMMLAYECETPPLDTTMPVKKILPPWF